MDAPRVFEIPGKDRKCSDALGQTRHKKMENAMYSALPLACCSCRAKMYTIPAARPPFLFHSQLGNGTRQAENSYALVDLL